MATRPVFIPTITGEQLFETRSVSFPWSSGFAEVQKKKNIKACHAAAKEIGIERVLEVSTKSDEEIGRRLSAFSLKYELGDRQVPLECLYQGSKVFSNGGPYVDLFELTPRECKKDQRLRKSGAIVAFQIGGETFDSRPMNAFYDWIYIGCLSEHENYLLQRMNEYDGFTDIEFNPEKSVNCQARALAVLISLSKRGLLQECAKSFDRFRTEISRTFSTL